MTDIQLYHQLSLLPDKLKQEVENFIQFLKHKEKLQKPIKKRQFGCAKGKIKMLQWFIEPFEHFYFTFGTAKLSFFNGLL